MRAETVLKIQLERKAIREKEKAVKELLKERPPKLPESRGLSIEQRFERLHGRVFEMCINPTPYGDGRFVDGKTPKLEIPVENNGEIVGLGLSFELVEDIQEHYLEARWSCDGLPDFKQTVEEDSASGELTAMEWSVSEYRRAAGVLEPTIARKKRFRKEFVAKIESGELTSVE